MTCSSLLTLILLQQFLSISPTATMTYDSFGRFPNKLSRNPGPVSQVDASQCHPEPIRFAQGKLREGSVALGVEMLRCAQHDSIVTHAASRECHPAPQRRVTRERSISS